MERHDRVTSEQDETRRRYVFLGAIVVALVYRVGLWWTAKPTFEDALITYTHARNAAEGIGLTHHAGEPPVHGFTSALSVLIPLAGELMSSGVGLDVLRSVSLGATVAAIWFAYLITRNLGLGPWPTALVLGFLAVERHQVFFGVAGMETQLAVAILLGSVLAVMERRPVLVGVSLGLAALVRPDYAIWGVIAVATVATWGWRPLARTVVVAGVIVLPWLTFATLYYGSPVPNTVSAKSAAYVPPINSLDTIPWWIAHQILDHVEGLAFTFAPFFSDSGVADAVIPRGAALAVSLTIFGLAIVGARATWSIVGWRPAIIFVVAFMVYRTFLLPTTYFEWYLPPFTALAAILAGAGIQAIADNVPRASRAAPAMAVVLLAAIALHMPWETAFRIHIRSISEQGPVLRQVGEYLADHVAPGEAVVTEPAGYIGFYSRALLYDWPGLTSKVALDTYRSLEDRSLESFIDRLQPEWIALRGWELDQLTERFPQTAERYTIRATFGHDDEWRPGDPMPTIGIFGYEVNAFSARFYVLARADDTGLLEPDTESANTGASP